MKTRKAILILSIAMILAYTVADCLLTWLNTEYQMSLSFDSTLTTEWFSFWKWVVTTGTVVTVSKVLKGKTNSDDDEQIDTSNKGISEEVNE